MNARRARVLSLVNLTLASLSSCALGSCGGEEEAPVMAAPMPPPPAPPATPAIPEPPPTPPPPPVPSVPGCEVIEPASALEADSLVGILHLLSEQIVTGEDTPTAETAFDARTALCPEACDSTQPFLTYFSPEDDARLALVVPHEGGGFFVLPALARGEGMVARCPDDLRGELHTSGELVRLHVTALVNEFLECDRDGDGVADPNEDESPCPSGCIFRDRTDRELLISPRSGRYVIVSRQLAVGTGEVEGIDRLAGVAIRVEGSIVSIDGCGEPRRFDLTDPVPAAEPAVPTATAPVPTVPAPTAPTLPAQ